jgi:hypothetical protein
MERLPDFFVSQHLATGQVKLKGAGADRHQFVNFLLRGCVADNDFDKQFAVGLDSTILIARSAPRWAEHGP